MKLIMESWRTFRKINEEKEWSGRDPYEDDGRIDPTPIPEDELTTAQKLSDELEAFIKRHVLSPKEMDRVNFYVDGLYDGFPSSAQFSSEQYAKAIEDAFKDGDAGLKRFFKIEDD